MTKPVIVTMDHVILLRESFWDTDEYGGIVMDGVCPFGNSGRGRFRDVMTMLEWDIPEDGPTEEQWAEAERIWDELPRAHELILLRAQPEPDRAHAKAAALHRGYTEGKWAADRISDLLHMIVYGSLHESISDATLQQIASQLAAWGHHPSTADGSAGPTERVHSTNGGHHG